MQDLNDAAQAVVETPSIRGEIFSWIRCFAVALAVVLLVRFFLFTMIRVDGHSMDQTLNDGDRLFVTLLDMRIHGPSRYDVVICTYPGEDHLCVKRVIGLPGDTVEIIDGATYVNGELTDEDFVLYPALRDMEEITVPEDHYFVMGDNRGNSKDSRDTRVGALERSAIHGKVRAIFWPLGRAQLIAHAQADENQ